MTTGKAFKGQGVYFNPELNINGERIQYKDSTYITDLLTEHAIDWLDHRDKDKPFFMYLSHKAVHAEFEPAPRHKGRYKGKKNYFACYFLIRQRMVKYRELKMA